MYDFRAISVRRSTEKSTWSQSPWALLEPAILTTPKKKMAAIAANIERIQQQMQSELEKFKAIQKGDLQLL